MSLEKSRFTFLFWHRFVRLAGIVGGLGLIFPISSFAACHADPTDNASVILCDLINRTEKFKGCSGLTTPYHEACLSLEVLRDGGECSELKALDDVSAFLICGEIFLGFAGHGCEAVQESGATVEEDEGLDLLVQGEVRDQMCRFGNELTGNYPTLGQMRANALLRKEVELVLSSTSVAGSPAETEKVRNLSYRMLQILEQTPHFTTKSTTFSADVLTLIRMIETQVYEWATEAEKNETELFLEPGYEAKTGQKLPFGLQISPSGDVIIHLDNYLGEDGKVVNLKKLGAGSFKTFTFSLDYQSAIGTVAPNVLGQVCLASGKMKPASAGPKASNAICAISDADFKDAEVRGARIQNLFNGKRGIAPSVKLSKMNTRRKSKGDVVVSTTQWFPHTLPSFLRVLKDPKRKSFEGLSRQKIKTRLALDLLTGLETLHQNQIVHRDIKPENVLVGFDEEGLPKPMIADFGSAYDVRQRPGMQGGETLLGTPVYMAPEFLRLMFTKNYKTPEDERLRILKEASSMYSADVWSMALVLDFIDTEDDSKYPNKSMPFFAIKAIETYEKLGEVFGIKFDPENPPDPSSYRFVLFRMFNPMPASRATAAEARKLMEAVDAGEGKRLGVPFAMKPLSINTNTYTTTKRHWKDMTVDKSPREYKGIQYLEREIRNLFQSESRRFERIKH